jgi:Neutral/alkaline non-lysosomal ceramidase, N-terminal
MSRILQLSAALVLFCSFVATVRAHDAPWKVGLASVKITPEQPLFMAGYASRNKPFEAIHDDLYAKALVLDDGQGTRTALVTTDLIGFRGADAQPLRETIAEKTGIKATSIIINSSHTHTGPALSRSDLSAEGREHTERTLAYLKQLQDKIVELVAQAAKDMRPAKLSWGTGVVHFVMNRREFTVDRGVILGVNPRGLADRSVPVLRIDGADGKLRGVVFGAACHNTTLGGNHYDISGDYAGHAQRLIESQHPGATAMFMQGCAGDANPYPRGSYEIAEQHGVELATEVARVLSTKLSPVRGPLKTAWSEVALPLAPPPSRDELARRAAGKGGPGWAAEQILAKLDRGEKLDTEYTCPVSVWQFGEDLTLVSLSGEVVVDYVKMIEDAIGPNRLWVSAYNHDVFGYLPSARVLREGGYETRGLIYGGIGLFAPHAQDVLVAKVRELASSVGRKLP